MSLVLIVVAAKVTFTQFANRLCTHHRQGSWGGDPNGDERNPGALPGHCRYFSDSLTSQTLCYFSDFSDSVVF